MSVTNKKQWNNLLAKARHGNSDAQWEVGFYYDEGMINKSGEVIVKIQPLRAVHWYTLSAEQGNESSQLALGNILSMGSVERDINAAIYWTKQAIEKGSSTAAHSLGTIYRDLKKPDIAFFWYKKAVEMGELDSLFQVGLCYCFGVGIEKDLKLAYKCFQQIVEDGKPPFNLCESTKEDAFYWIAIFQLLEIGDVKSSIADARKLLESANKDLDHEQANEILNVIGKTEYINL